jgi:hypothetical protein
VILLSDSDVTDNSQSVVDESRATSANVSDRFEQGQQVMNKLAVAASVAARANSTGRWVVPLFWSGAAFAVIGMALFMPFGWDARDYLLAVQQYSAYVHGQASLSLAYSPLFMIPTLGLVTLLPLWLAAAIFWLTYFAGFVVQIWVGLRCATESERKILCYIAPAIAFFPGLLISESGVIVSGNLAYILYGAMFAGAAWGWKRNNWSWFYIAVLLSACAKVHLLTMLAIPLLCGERQWRRALVTGSVGVGLYALQARIWPQPFHTYLNSLHAMSQSRRDFGCGPVGNLARTLQHYGAAYYEPCVLFYVVYAVVMFLVLFSLSKLYRERRISFTGWVPVMLLGVVLLNPRILAYDVAAVTLPMALIVWRSLTWSEVPVNKPKVIVGALSVFIGLNLLVEVADNLGIVPDAAKYAEMLLMLGIFANGVWGLLREAGIEPFTSAAYAIESSSESD